MDQQRLVLICVFCLTSLNTAWAKVDLTASELLDKFAANQNQLKSFVDTTQVSVNKETFALDSSVKKKEIRQYMVKAGYQKSAGGVKIVIRAYDGERDPLSGKPLEKNFWRAMLWDGEHSM